MKSRLLSTLTCMIALFFVSSFGYAASNAVNIGSGGIIFPDNSVQNKAVVLPSCNSGEVYVNSTGALLCGKVMPIANGIATCVSGICNVSACMQGYADCDNNIANGCETNITTPQNCGCGVTCPASNDCVTYACTNGACTPTFTSAGTLTSLNIPGNCQKSTCDGIGHITNVVDNNNLPYDGNECTNDFCVAGVPFNPPVTFGTSCTGGTCNGSGLCISTPTCNDGVKNGNETAVDCGGGTCPKCASGLQCSVSGDCTSSVCTAGTCRAPTCTDGVKNGTETDVDCGGVCTKCSASKQCNSNSDCTSNNCSGNICQP